MSNYLSAIVAHKREELSSLKRQHTWGSLLGLASEAPEPVSLSASVSRGGGVIAEFKRRSPSKGAIHEGLSPRDVVPGYEAAGACGISCLTDGHFFGGSVDDLAEAVAATRLPVLRKEFMLDPLQVAGARAYGASAILLIAAILSPAQTGELAAAARELGMDVLLELHDAGECQHLCPDVTLVGVNNRNLRTFEVDLEHSLRLLPDLPPELPKVAESGVHTPDDARRLLQGGFQALLIGEQFMAAQDPAKACRDFCQALRTTTAKN